MTQTPNDAEVQNVLSSIRRLINDNRPSEAATPAPFVLGPALRVGEPAAPPPDPEPLVLRSPVVPPAAGSASAGPVTAGPIPVPVPPPEPAPSARLILTPVDPPAAPPAPPEAAPSAAPAPSAEPAPPPEAGAALPLDERVLRLLVAEVVREELQGELGERMTRNLRKLVRREILQALAASRDEA